MKLLILVFIAILSSNQVLADFSMNLDGHKYGNGRLITTKYENVGYKFPSHAANIQENLREFLMTDCYFKTKASFEAAQFQIPEGGLFDTLGAHVLSVSGNTTGTSSHVISYICIVQLKYDL